MSDRHRQETPADAPGTVLNVLHLPDYPTIPPAGLRALSERIEQMREEERRRIARELHDELGQLLTGIKLDFSASLRRMREVSLPGDITDKLQSAIGQIDIAITMVRRIAGDLRPAALDHRDLGGAIEDEARRVSARSGLRVRVSNRVSIDLEPELATAAFRIFQEALTNAVRHAQASRVHARITTTDERLLMAIHDDGIGLPGNRSGSDTSLGMLGMHERARSVGGQLRLRSRTGRGTLVLFRLPLEARDGQP
jgi:signal transduction histidine kinase